MPIYEYECKKCDKIIEQIQKFSDPLLKKCPECGGKVEKLISKSSFILKGSGYYSTDYKKPTETPAPAKTEKERPEIAEAREKVGCKKKNCGHKH